MKKGVKNSQFNTFEKEIEKEVKTVEKWIIARRKFFLKFIATSIFVAVLLIILSRLSI